MNRAEVRGTSLEAQAKWHESEGGYYQQGNMGSGALENAAHRAILEQSLKNVLGGSNISNYATDNASGDLAARGIRAEDFCFALLLAVRRFLYQASASNLKMRAVGANGVVDWVLLDRSQVPLSPRPRNPRVSCRAQGSPIAESLLSHSSCTTLGRLAQLPVL